MESLEIRQSSPSLVNFLSSLKLIQQQTLQADKHKKEVREDAQKTCALDLMMNNLKNYDLLNLYS